MSNYCFAAPDERRVLFTEAIIRGWLAAIRDFPQLKDREQCSAPAQAECDVLLQEVCCVTDQAAYQQLVSSAWVTSYLAFNDLTDRQATYFADLRHGTTDEALSILRREFSDEKHRTEIDKAYAQFLALREE